MDTTEFDTLIETISNNTGLLEAAVRNLLSKESHHELEERLSLTPAEVNNLLKGDLPSGAAKIFGLKQSDLDNLQEKIGGNLGLGLVLGALLYRDHKRQV